MFGSRLKEARLRANLTQDALAELIGTDARRIWSYESGKNKPNGEVIALLAQQLETSTDFLLGLTDDPSRAEKPFKLSHDELKVLTAIRRGDRLGAIKLIVETETP